MTDGTDGRRGDGAGRGDGASDLDPETAARRLVTDLLAGGETDAVDELFADPERVSVRGRDGQESDGGLRDYFDRLADRYDRHRIEVASVLPDGDSAVVRWRLVDDGDVTARAVTAVTVGDGGITRVTGDVEPAAVTPAATRGGAAGALQNVGDCVVVLASDGTVVEANDAALETFDRERAAVLGEPVAALLGPSPDFEAGEEYLVTGPFGRREFEVRVFDADAARRLAADRTLVARDVTERRRRRQQLSVLNRVLRHNLRNDLDVIRSRVEYARRTGDDDVSETLGAAAAATDDLLATADDARTVQSLLDDPTRRSVDLAELARETATRARESYPDATVRVDESTAASPQTTVIEGFDRAVWELVENACEHAGPAPTVVVGVERVGQFLRLRVTDDGPGLPDDERMVLNRAVETSLDHGSGLGLWLARWLVDAAGGALTFAVDGGTTARVDLFDGDRIVSEPLAGSSGRRRNG